MHVHVPGASRGTGYRVADNLVLTATHVVETDAGDDSPIEVCLFETDEWVRAWVIGAEPADGLDMALLEVDAGGLPAPRTPAPQWGHLVGAAGVSVHAVGFSKAMKGDAGPDTHLIRGIVEPAHGAQAFGRGKASLAVDRDSIVPSRRPEWKSPWSGGSGAAVFAAHTGQLIGVITDDLDIADSARVLQVSLVEKAAWLVELAGNRISAVAPDDSDVAIPYQAGAPNPPPPPPVEDWLVERECTPLAFDYFLDGDTVLMTEEHRP